MNLDYLAGIIDGEGTIGIYPYKTKGHGEAYVPYISVANTDMRLIKSLISFFKELKISCSLSTKPRKKENHKISYAVSVKFNSAIKLAEILRGRLLLKNKQCLILSDEYKNCTPKNGQYTSKQLRQKATLIKKIHVLNRLGSKS